MQQTAIASNTNPVSPKNNRTSSFIDILHTFKMDFFSFLVSSGLIWPVQILQFKSNKWLLCWAVVSLARRPKILNSASVLEGFGSTLIAAGLNFGPSLT